MTKGRFIAIAIGLMVVLTSVYSNHFNNGFYFDDIHTIVNNEYVRSIQLKEYFTNIETFGTMPNNRGYRPIVTLLNAIDYAISGWWADDGPTRAFPTELDAIIFHISIWFWYLVQGVLLFFFLLNLFRKVDPESDMRMPVLLTAAFYMFHTGNAETVNYIISRSDSFSTTMMLAGMVMFQNERTRKTQLFILPFIVAMFTKEVSFMFVPLVGLYHYFFIQEGDLKQLISVEGWKKVGRGMLSILPVAIIGIGLILMNLLYMTDPSRIAGGLAHDRWDYFTSQFIVVAHYIGNFVLPINLSADPDFVVTSDFSRNKFLGMMLIGALHLIGFWCLSKKHLLPIGFGIIWFFLCLIPTSTINPLYQVANDHRVFLPYIGLCISIGWTLWLIYSTQPKLKTATLILSMLILGGHAYGTYQRNEVWGSAESLWKDATVKSPNNGRALMNYGLVLMRNAQYEEAEPYFRSAVEKLPYWPYSNINYAILLDAMKKTDQAKVYFDRALTYGSNNPESYYFYARWHYQNGRIEDAAKLLEKGHDVSPKHIQINQLLNTLREMGVTPENRAENLRQIAEADPTPNNYIELSLALYQLKDYKGCVRACRSALDIDPKNAMAYNNMCSAYNKMGDWQKAIEACENALRIDPTFDRAKNNLNWAKSSIQAK